MEENALHSGSKSPSVQASPSSLLHKSDARRLRASCDGCYLSKVKCTKETPACRRCLNHGAVCKYSPSQRVGKPRRLRENQQVHDGSTTGETGAARSSNSRSTSDASLHPPRYSWSINFDPSVTVGSSGFNFGDEISSMMWPNPLSVTDSENMLDSPRDSNLSSPVECLEYPDASHPSSAGLDRLGPSVQHQPPQPMFSEEHMLLQDPLPQLYFPSPRDPVAAAGSLPAADTCACTTAPFDILRTLHDQSSHTSFDKVLSINKSAVSTISTILSCPCARDSTSIMTLVVALTKIMSRYQSIGGPASQSSGGTQTPDALTFSPSPTPITLGAYRLDGAEEEQVKLQVILSELRKVDSLMPRFQERFCIGPVKQEARMYHELVSFLLRQLKDTVEGLQRDLQTVYETSSL